MIRSNSQRQRALNIPETKPFLPNSPDSNENNSHKPSSITVAKPENPLIAIIKAVLACSLYMVIGPSLILNNKYILKDLDFKYPMFVSCLGLITTSFVSHFLVGVARVVELKHRNVVTREFYMKRIVPVGVTLALTLSFGNAVYIHLGVALIQMLKAFTPVIVLLGVVVSGLEVPSRGVVISVLGIVAGTVMNCAGSTNYTLWGLFLMFGAEFFEAVRLVLTQFLLKNKKFGVIEGQYWLVS